MANSKHEAQIPVGCRLCEGGNKIHWKCLDCSLLMCTRCRDGVHRRLNNANSHRIVDTKDYKCAAHVRLLRHFPTFFQLISTVVSSHEDSLWILDYLAKVVKNVNMATHPVKVISQVNISIHDMAVTSSNNILISVDDETNLKLLNGITGQISDTQYNVAPLKTRGIHISGDQIFIIATKKLETFTATRRSVVIIMDEEGNRVREYELDSNNKPLFSLPRKITSTGNGNIWVVDLYDKSLRGRVVVLGQAGNIVQIYTGHPDVNSWYRTFTPRGIVTTPADNIVVTDCNNDTLHILSCDGVFITYVRTDDLGIIDPYSLALSGPGQLYIGCSAISEISRSSDKAGLFKVQYSGF